MITNKRSKAGGQNAKPITAMTPDGKRLTMVAGRWAERRDVKYSRTTIQKRIKSMSPEEALGFKSIPKSIKKQKDISTEECKRLFLYPAI